MDEPSFSEAGTAHSSSASSTSVSGGASSSTPPENTLNGYPELAHFMGKEPSLAIFRRFGELNALNLLWMQAELVHCELKLKDLAEDDRKSSDPRRWKRRLDWTNFQLRPGETVADDHWQTAMHTRKLLRNYNAELLTLAKLERLPRPRHTHLKFVHDWMLRTKLGDISLRGEDCVTWEEYPLSDLQAIYATHYEDPLTRWLTGHALLLWHKCFGQRIAKDEEGQKELTTVYRNDKIENMVSYATVALSSLFPLLAILVLTHIKVDWGRLLVMSFFSGLFSVALGLLSGNEKRLEVFAATAAFAAVQVVFISGTSSNSNLSTSAHSG